MFHQLRRLYIQTVLKTKKAFTLIELLVVVLIIGILAAIAVPQYQRATESSRVSEAVLLLNGIAQAEQMYFLQMGRFTSNFAELVLSMPVKPAESEDTSDYSYGSTKAFDYDLSACSGHDCVLSALRRVGTDYPYSIQLTGIASNNSSFIRTCHSTDEFGISVCLLICAADEMESDGSCLIK